jgi:Mg-chelatase subunit ChlD
VLEAPANIVASRLAERGAPQSLSDIEELASAELVHAEQTCLALGIPLIRLPCPSEDKLQSAIQSLM